MPPQGDKLSVEVPLESTAFEKDKKSLPDHHQDTAAGGSSSEDEESPLPRTDDKKKKDDGDDMVDEQLFQFLTGMKDDLKARAPYYANDWGRPKNVFTVINATIFTFVVQLIPALIFADLMDRQTDGNLSVAEVILSSAIMGIIYAVFSGQPLVVMGITGPVALLLGTSYGLTAQFDAAYFPFFFWTCVWAGLMHIISAMVGLVSLVWKVSPFTSQIFEFFIAITFIYSSLYDLIQPMHLTNDPNVTAQTRAAGYAAFVIGLITCYVSWSLHFAETWIFFSREIRTFLTSYNTLIAVVVATSFSYIPGFDQNGSIERVFVVAPWDWEPSADRPWVVNPLQGIDAKGIFGAMIPGFMFFLLFIIDHNVSSILTQSPKFNLKKPSAYHWDFFIVGITFFPCAILGLPPGNGLIPQAPLHCRALCTRKFVTDSYGVRREVVTHCEEQRWSGLGQACLMFVALSCFTVISWIPNGCLFGLLLYLGMSTYKRENPPIFLRNQLRSTLISFFFLVDALNENQQVHCMVTRFGNECSCLGFIPRNDH
jgi:boron transporter